MESSSSLFNFARDGRLDRMRSLLQARGKEEVTELVCVKTNGATPLIMSSRYGHLHIVEYLITHCKANIHQTGSVTFDGETIEGAPPLWCAAAAGHQAVVHLLINCGADVNCTTSTNSTPLRAACFDGHHNIVKFLISRHADIEIANRHGHTCLMISCYKGHDKIVKFLVEKGANVNRSSLKGNTALHDCAESGNLDILKYLLDAGAKIAKDCYGMTPLLAAAVTGHKNIVQYLSHETECSDVDMINALELLGATFIDKKRDMTGGLNLWKQAMNERAMINEEKPVVEKKVVAYENAEEARTVDQLTEFMSDPDKMRMQALLVRERILGPAHPDTSYYIRYRGAVYADLGNFERCISLWTYALDMQQQNLDPLSLMTQSSFLSFAELFFFMGVEGRNTKPQTIDFTNMIHVFQRSIAELQSGQKFLLQDSTDKDQQNYNRLLVVIMHLLSLICSKINQLSKEESYALKKIVYEFVHMNPVGGNNYSPLHLACSKDTSNVGRYPVCRFPSLPVVDLLLEVGSCTNTVDSSGNTPLHIAAINQPCKHDIVKVLLHHGAHLDSRNEKGLTFIDLLGDVAIYDIVCPLNYISLQCLAARKLKACNVRYESCVPKKIADFIQLH